MELEDDEDDDEDDEGDDEDEEGEGDDDEDDEVCYKSSFRHETLVGVKFFTVYPFFEPLCTSFPMSEPFFTSSPMSYYFWIVSPLPDTKQSLLVGVRNFIMSAPRRGLTCVSMSVCNALCECSGRR